MSLQSRFRVLSFVSFVVMASAVNLAICTHSVAQSDADVERFIVENYYAQFKGTSGFVVVCSLSGSAEALGFDEGGIKDRAKLRLTNTIAGAYIFSDHGKAPEERFDKPAQVRVQVFTSGDSYPVALYVEVEAGVRGNLSLFREARLEVSGKQEVSDAVADAVDELIDSFAVAFHKGVGDF